MQKSQGRVTDERRNAHHLPLHICMCIYRCRYIDIYSHKHMHLYAGRICSRSGREGSDCLSPVDSHPPHAPAPNQTRPRRNTQASRRALQTPAKIPANEELRLPQKHLAAACSALGSGAGRGSVPRKSLAGRDDFICPVREIASVSESHRGVCNGPSLLVPWHTVASR